MREPRTNAQYLFLLRAPNDMLSIRNLAYQLYPQQAHILLDAYAQCCNSPYGYLLVTMHPSAPDIIKLRTGILPYEQSLIFTPWEKKKEKERKKEKEKEKKKEKRKGKTKGKRKGGGGKAGAGGGPPLPFFPLSPFFSPFLPFLPFSPPFSPFLFFPFPHLFYTAELLNLCRG